MAADYDARANVADEVTEQSSSETDTEQPEPLANAAKGLAEPRHGEALSVEPKVRIATEPKGTILVERRPVGRPRRG
jgi:hypothetical protein